MAAPPENAVPVRSFEALLLRGCEGDATILEAARAIGVDLDNETAWYSLTVWRELIELVRHHRFADLPVEAGREEVGLLYIRGFVRTLVGRVFAGMARMSGPERVLSRVPRYMHTGRSDLQIRVDSLGLRDWRVIVEDRHPSPHFMIGVFRGILELCGVKQLQMEILEEGPTRYVLAVRWSPPSA